MITVCRRILISVLYFFYFYVYVNEEAHKADFSLDVVYRRHVLSGVWPGTFHEPLPLGKYGWSVL